MGELLLAEFTDPDAANVPSPFPRRMAIVPLFSATAKSVLPSPLKSPVAKYDGIPEIGGLVVSAVKVPSPLPRRMSTVELSAVDNGQVGNSISIEICDHDLRRHRQGKPGTEAITGSANVPSPLPSRIAISFEPYKGTAKSGIPSPLKSATDDGITRRCLLNGNRDRFGIGPIRIAQVDGHHIGA